MLNSEQPPDTVPLGRDEQVAQLPRPLRISAPSRRCFAWEAFPATTTKIETAVLDETLVPPDQRHDHSIVMKLSFQQRITVLPWLDATVPTAFAGKDSHSYNHELLQAPGRNARYCLAPRRARRFPCANKVARVASAWPGLCRLMICSKNMCDPDDLSQLAISAAVLPVRSKRCSVSQLLFRNLLPPAIAKL